MSQTFAQQAVAETPRDAYEINLKLDFDERTFAGTERVRWTNRDDRPASALYFHLYPNLRALPNAQQSDEPRLEITEVRAADNGAALSFALDEQLTTLRVNLRAPVAAGASTEVLLSFKGIVPEIDAEETGILAHIVQQVDAVLRSEREMRRARDINFRCRGVMLLGAAYPVLAARDGSDWQRKVETSIGDSLFAEAASYRVKIETGPGLTLYSSGTEETPEGAQGVVFSGEDLRSFALIAGRSLRVQERVVAGVRVRSIYTAEREVVGRRVLGIAAAAVEAYTARFGELPYKQLSIAEAPLVAGLGGIEFSGFVAIASAFYVDFD
ncbi:MAG: hypothetical protein JO360_13730, partial [Acidobacteria bacterium]|nr:hypothetical protein [Acidobacteriota bacterium]